MSMTKIKIKSPKFWVKLIAGLAGGLLASGQIPEILLPLFSEGVYQALGGVIAALMAAWLGKDHKADKQSAGKAKLMGLLVVLLISLPSCISMTKVTVDRAPDGSFHAEYIRHGEQQMNGLEIKNFMGADITVESQKNQGYDLEQLLQLAPLLQP